MSAQDTTVMVVQETPNFLDDTVDLKKLLRAITKETPKAVTALVKLLESKDERTVMAAARGLIELQVTVADKISADQMSRLIAQVKLRNPTPTLVPLGSPEQKQRPLVDFGTVREIA